MSLVICTLFKYSVLLPPLVLLNILFRLHICLKNILQVGIFYSVLNVLSVFYSVLNVLYLFNRVNVDF